MRTVLFLSFFLLFLNCEDKQTRKKGTSKTEVVRPLEEEAINNSFQEPEREFPKLNSKSAMEFFLEYDKFHITTRY